MVKKRQTNARKTLSIAEGQSAAQVKLLLYARDFVVGSSVLVWRFDLF